MSLTSPGVLGLVNFSDGGVLDTTSRFQIASPASYQPECSPTRGSGDGAAPVVAVVEAHAAVNSNTMASDDRELGRRGKTADFMADPVGVAERCEEELVTDGARRPIART